MILHLINDEKIVNRTIESYEAVLNNENVFIVFAIKVLVILFQNLFIQEIM